MNEIERTNAEKARTAAWVNEKWVAADKSCPICTTNNWTVDQVVELRPYRGGLITGHTTTFPAAQVICINCGYTHFFNAVVAGVVVASEYENVTQ